MQQNRRNEIEAKKSKLAELKRQRELRQREFAAGRESLAPLEATLPTSRTEDRQELDRLIDTLVGESNTPSTQRQTATSSVPERYPSHLVPDGSEDVEAEGTAGVAGQRPQTRIGAPQRLGFSSLTTTYEIKADPPKREVITYSKGVQTMDAWTRSRFSSASESDGEGRLLGERPPMRSLSRRQREKEEKLEENIRKEIEEEIKAKLELRITYEKVEEKPKHTSKATKARKSAEMEAVMSSNDFLDFLERSTKVVERALDEDYNVLVDYRFDHIDDEDDGDGLIGRAKGRRVKEICQFYDERWNKNRSVTDICFSPKSPELILTSYTKSSSSAYDPDGLLQIWNLHSPSRPEFTLNATSPILTTTFSPFNPKLIIGGTYSGQVLLWDLRSPSPSPSQQTPFTNTTGHTHPIYSINTIGTQNAHNIITTSTDGVVCSWAIDRLSKPTQQMTLRSPNSATVSHYRNPFAYDVAPTCTAFPPGQTTYFLAGTEQGPIQLVHRHDRAGGSAGIDPQISYRGHAGPVTGIGFHNAAGPHNLGDLVLSSGLDWSVKLWRVRTPAAAVVGRIGSGIAGSRDVGHGRGEDLVGPESDLNRKVVEPLLELQRDDAVYDVKWNPTRPGVFACVDGAGYLEIWDLNTDIEVPAARIRPAARTTQDARTAEDVMRSSAGGKVAYELPHTGANVSSSLNKCAWESGEGKRVAVGGLDGVVSVFEVGSGLGGVEGVEVAEWDGMKRLINRCEERIRRRENDEVRKGGGGY